MRPYPMALMLVAIGNVCIGQPPTFCDFNGDGRGDLAVGIPRDQSIRGSLTRGGSLTVVMGLLTGLDPQFNQFWSQQVDGILGHSKSNDRFGGAVSSGDFNGDGFADLLIGVPGEDVNHVYMGGIAVLYGGWRGLRSDGNQLFTQNSGDGEGRGDFGEEFGGTVAAGDVNGDGFDEAAAGIVYDTVGDVQMAGGVEVFYGSDLGLISDSDQWINEGTIGTDGMPEESDFFGSAVALGDFDADGFDDLAIGAMGEEIDGHSPSRKGAVHIVHGSAAGLNFGRTQLWDADVLGFATALNDDGRFGDALSCADFNRDGFEDLAVGACFAVVTTREGNLVSAGGVYIMYGSADGLTASGAQFWSKSSPGIDQEIDRWDYRMFGRALASGDFDGDGFVDLAIGAPQDGLTQAAHVGAVHVLYGDEGGLSAERYQYIDQDTPGVPDQSEESYEFGGDFWAGSLAAIDFDGDGCFDLAVGNESESLGEVDNAGSVTIIYGSKRGLDTRRCQYGTQHTRYIRGTPELNDCDQMALPSR